ncbi:FxDxF family PEP-CTERM protein [Tsuneonella amylolytica]|uniref:FxDxF family PEP-CTERM protein n=1 Tax=Tsuneonella amylolytica TaxID=2338327 RepID=UPI000EAABA17|nr:FxDxF family PEP-CTERM protein [Tsuneonella amylolytica]
MTMLHRMLTATAVVAVAFATPASAADIFPEGTPAAATNPPNSTFEVVGDPFSGAVSATIGNAGIATGLFTDRFIFRLGQNGLGSGSITTTLAGALGGRTDLDFLSATLFNGFTSFVVPLSPNGAFEFGALTNVPIFADVANVLTINGRSRGAGSYGGDLSFVPTAAVPEPATWALMLLGFAGIGVTMRRRRKDKVRVRYAF